MTIYLRKIYWDCTDHSILSDRKYSVKDIASGMQFLAKNNIVHRQLTTKRVLVEKNNRVYTAKIADTLNN